LASCILNEVRGNGTKSVGYLKFSLDLAAVDPGWKVAKSTSGHLPKSKHPRSPFRPPCPGKQSPLAESRLHTHSQPAQTVEKFCAAAAESAETKGGPGLGFGKCIFIFIFLDFAHKMRISLYGHKHLGRWTLQRVRGTKHGILFGASASQAAGLRIPESLCSGAVKIYYPSPVLMHVCTHVTASRYLLPRKTISNWAVLKGALSLRATTHNLWPL